MPVLAIPHGGGPCFQLPDGAVGPPGFWLMMGAYLKNISKSLPAKPKAMLMCVRASAKQRCPAVRGLRARTWPPPWRACSEGLHLRRTRTRCTAPARGALHAPRDRRGAAVANAVPTAAVD